MNVLKVKLQIWDTAGQERFRTITSAYYRGAHGVIFVYDITDKASFDSVSDWLNEAQRHADQSAVKLVVGNKVDLNDARQVTQNEGAQYAKEIEASFIETSAKSAVNVDKAFLIIAKHMMGKR